MLVRPGVGRRLWTGLLVLSALSVLTVSIACGPKAAGGGGGAAGGSGTTQAAGAGGGNPEQGRQFVATKAAPSCGTCHVIPGVQGAAGAIGPSLAGIGNRAGTNKAGKPAEQYLRDALVTPNADIAEGFQPAMPPFTLSDQDLGDVVAFLMTLK